MHPNLAAPLLWSARISPVGVRVGQNPGDSLCPRAPARDGPQHEDDKDTFLHKHNVGHLSRTWLPRASQAKWNEMTSFLATPPQRREEGNELLTGSQFQPDCFRKERKRKTRKGFRRHMARPAAALSPRPPLGSESGGHHRAGREPGSPSAPPFTPRACGLQGWGPETLDRTRGLERGGAQ